MLPKNFNKKTVWITAMAVLVISCANADVGSNWIRQFGITWTFDKNISLDGSSGTYQYGVFANGDYWIKGPVTIVSIAPASTTVNGRTINGSMTNPVFGGGYQGYDSSNPYTSYSAALNKAANMPLAVAVDTSLISTVSNPLPAQRARPFTGFAILTILSSAPPAGSFRPSPFGTDKTILHNKSELYTDSSKTAYKVLASLPYVAGKYPSTAKPPLSRYESVFEVPMIEIVPGWTQQFSTNCRILDAYGADQPYYGEYIANVTGQAALCLNMDYSVAEKEKLLVSYVQYGLDLYETVKTLSAASRGNWIGEGGHGHGRKLPLMLAGEILQDAGIRALWPKTGDYLYSNNYYGSGVPVVPSDYIHFGEDDQTFYVTNWEVSNASGYTADKIGEPEWGFSHSTYPSWANADWTNNQHPAVYRYALSSTSVATTLAAHIMNFRGLWNHDAYFNYADRNKITSVSGYDFGDWVPFASNMWSAYRANYGSVWPNTVPNTYTLSATASNGSISKSPNQTSYASGTQVVLTASPDAGYSFSGWVGSITGSSNPVTITMNSDKSVQANFVPTQNQTPIAELLNSAVVSQLSERTFDGIDDYQSVSTTGWNPAGTTITLWAKPADVNGLRYLFGHNVGNWTNTIQLYLNNGSLCLGLGGVHFRQTDMATFQTNQWYFISLSLDGTTYAVTVNGQVKGAGAYTGLAQLNTFADIGNDGNPADRTESFSGIIDDVRIYNRALSGAETTSIYDYGRNDGLTAHWLLDDASGDVTIDHSGYQISAELVGSPSIGQAWKQEDYVQFNSRTQAFVIPAGTITAGKGTLAFWLSPENLTGAQFIFGHVFNDSNRIALYTIADKLAVGMGSSLALRTGIATLTVGSLYHLALTWDGTACAVYVNGQLCAFSHYSGLSQMASTADVANYGSAASRTVGFTGIFYDIRTYSRALSQDEIKALHKTHDVLQGRKLAFAVSGTDASGNPVSYQAADLPSGASFDIAGQTLIWKPWYNQADTAITFTAPGQPVQTVNVSVCNTPLANWYRNFLIFEGKL